MEEIETTFAGKAGQAFGVYGQGFGDEVFNKDGSPAGRGKVTLNGTELAITRWKDYSIKGILPADAEPGPVVVTAADGRKFTTQFGKPVAVKPAAK